ncbi:LysR family transcriptional regulator [Paraburkholderia sp. HD33-4]|uniref:LysR family transcriptional regulator n=1 Tax=Paraburkholderia sp. HD33-4 TaxID=2883242 RepID=UPI001F1D890C|nr:LysR family transcriptional regulator [Paraburkholderia sp. HD33-4]
MASVTPDMRLLRVFASVVRHQGFASAQQELNMSTSAISTYMSQLEDLVGVVLCHRGRGGFSLTPKGTEFHLEAQRLLGEVDGFERYAAGLRGELRGSLKIGVLDGLVTDRVHAIDAVVSTFAREHSSVELHIRLQTPYELQLSVLSNRIDIAVGAFQIRMNGLIYQPLYREQHWLYCGDSHPLFNVRRVTEQDLAGYRMVGRAYWNQAEHVRHGLRDTGATVDSMEGQLVLILSGAYIGFLPEHFAQRWVEEGRLRALSPAAFGFQAPFTSVVRRGRLKEPLIQKFRDILKRQLTA